MEDSSTALVGTDFVWDLGVGLGGRLKIPEMNWDFIAWEDWKIF